MAVELQELFEIFRCVGIVIQGMQLKDRDETILIPAMSVKVIEEGIAEVFEIIA